MSEVETLKKEIEELKEKLNSLEKNPIISDEELEKLKEEAKTLIETLKEKSKENPALTLLLGAAVGFILARLLCGGEK